MKKLALVILAGISFATANAQFQFGAKGGLNVTSLGGSDINDNWKSLVSFNLGVYARLPLVDRLSIQPELMYSGQGSKYNNPDYTRRLNYLNIPILLKYAAGNGFSIETGPQLGFLLAAHDKADGNSFTRKAYFNTADFAWAVGVAYRIPETKVGIDARYNFGIANVENRSQTGLTGSMRNNAFQFGLTYQLYSSGRRK